MTVLDIRKVGDPVLRKPAAEVTDFDAELREHYEATRNLVRDFSRRTPS